MVIFADIWYQNSRFWFKNKPSNFDNTSWASKALMLRISKSGIHNCCANETCTGVHTISVEFEIVTSSSSSNKSRNLVLLTMSLGSIQKTFKYTLSVTLKSWSSILGMSLISIPKPIIVWSSFGKPNFFQQKYLNCTLSF